MSSESKVFLVEYIDHRPIRIPTGLSQHKHPVELPAKDPKKNILRVTESERDRLLAMRNGADPCFKELSPV